MLSATCGTFQTCIELLPPLVRVLPTPLRRDSSSLPRSLGCWEPKAAATLGKVCPWWSHPPPPLLWEQPEQRRRVFCWNVTLRSSPALQVPLATGAPGLWRGLDAAQSAQAPGELVVQGSASSWQRDPNTSFLLLASLLLEGLFCFGVESGSPVAQAALLILTLILLFGLPFLALVPYRKEQKQANK